MSKVGSIAATLLCCTLFSATARAATSGERCTLPPKLRDEISKKYPGARVANATDLTADDREFFTKDHGDDCPGLVEVDFYGDGKPTWALVLFNSSRKKSALVVAHRLEEWEFQMLEPWGTGGVPVVWREEPGKYDDIYGTKTIRATYPVIVYCGYESWAIVYGWTGKKVEKVWISD